MCHALHQRNQLDDYSESIGNQITYWDELPLTVPLGL